MALDERQKIVGDTVREGVRVNDRAAKVRRQQTLLISRRAGVTTDPAQHVNSRAGDLAAFKRGDERLLVNDGPRDVLIKKAVRFMSKSRSRQLYPLRVSAGAANGSRQNPTPPQQFVERNECKPYLLLELVRLAVGRPVENI